MPQHGDIDDDSLKQIFEKDIARDGLTFVRYNEKTKVGLVRGFAKPDSTPRRSLSVMPCKDVMTGDKPSEASPGCPNYIGWRFRATASLLASFFHYWVPPTDDC
jgi:hypothetical protein